MARTEMERLRGIPFLFMDHDDEVIDHFVDSIGTDHLQIVGPELILGKMYQHIGYPDDGGDHFFRNLVLCRLVYPGSKLKTVEYFKRHLQMDVSVYTVYRFLDKLHSTLKQRIEDITFAYTRKVLRGRIGIVFYDLTTLYFETSEEDDFRIAGYSKDGKSQHPQIVIGLLVGGKGYPIGYEIFEGNTSEPKTLIPVLESFRQRFELERPIVVADAALLSQKNMDALRAEGYQYILGGRLKNESEAIKSKIVNGQIREGHPIEITHANGRLIVTYSDTRAHNDHANRMKGLKKLEKKVQSGKLSKKHLNNRGYNKYLKLSGDVVVTIDYEKVEADSVWDGLKGYISNTTLGKDQIVSTYQQLWQVEKAFRISKTDLRIRPIYHRIKQRIEAHICICFAAYALYKELERVLLENEIALSPEKAIQEIKEIRQLRYTLPKSGQEKTKLLKLTENQSLLMDMKF